MTGLSPQQRGAARSRLAAERERTTARLAALQRDLESIIASTASAAGADDEHDPEGSSTAFDRQHVAALLTSAEEQLAAIARAERRLDDGSYGRCEGSGPEIGAGRLGAPAGGGPAGPRPDLTATARFTSSRSFWTA